MFVQEMLSSSNHIFYLIAIYAVYVLTQCVNGELSADPGKVARVWWVLVPRRGRIDQREHVSGQSTAGGASSPPSASGAHRGVCVWSVGVPSVRLVEYACVYVRCHSGYWPKLALTMIADSTTICANVYVYGYDNLPLRPLRVVLWVHVSSDAYGRLRTRLCDRVGLSKQYACDRLSVCVNRVRCRGGGKFVYSHVCIANVDEPVPKCRIDDGGWDPVQGQATRVSGQRGDGHVWMGCDVLRWNVRLHPRSGSGSWPGGTERLWLVSDPHHV